MHGKGRALWCVGDQHYKVATVLHPARGAAHLHQRRHRRRRLNAEAGATSDDSKTWWARHASSPRCSSAARSARPWSLAAVLTPAVGRSSSAPTAAPRRAGHRGVAATVRAGLHPHLAVRDAVPPHPPPLGACTPAQTWSPCPDPARSSPPRPAPSPPPGSAAATATPSTSTTAAASPPGTPTSPASTPPSQPGATRARRRPARGRRLHRRQHRQPPPLRDPPPRHARRPRPVHGRARRTPGRSAPSPTTSTHGAATPAAVEGGIGFGLPPAGQPAAELAEHRAGADPGTGQGPVRRGRHAGTSSRGRCSPASGWRRPATAPPPPPHTAGAQGLMQFMPATFAAYGVDGDGDGRGEHPQRRRQHLLRRELPHPVRRHQRPGRGAPALFAYNHADLVRQRRPALRPRLRRRTPPTPRPAPTELAERGRQAHPRQASGDERHRQGRTPCSSTDAPPPTRTPGRSR